MGMGRGTDGQNDIWAYYLAEYYGPFCAQYPGSEFPKDNLIIRQMIVSLACTSIRRIAAAMRRLFTDVSSVTQ